MSEVKTYRCDICKETYHSDEVSGKLSINYDSKVHEHICPLCACNIGKLLSKPDIIDDLIIEKGKVEDCTYKLEDMIKTLRDCICGYRSWCIFSTLDNKQDYCKEMSDEIRLEYIKTKKAYCIWKIVACALIGAVVGNLLVTVL